MGTDELLCWRNCRDGSLSESAREASRHAMLEAYLPLVRTVVGRMTQGYFNSGVDADDFFQAGVLGLMRAFERFDPDYGVEFGSYASHRIRGQVLDELRKMDWVPRSIRKTKEYIAPIHSLDELQERKNRGMGSELLASAPHQEARQEQELELAEDLEKLQRELELLPSREADILRLSYIEGKSLKEIGEFYSLTEARICQIRTQAILALRRKTSLVVA